MKGVWDSKCCAYPPFARVIAGWYKRWRCAPLRARDVCLRPLQSLKRHRESVHRQSDGFSCRVCDRRFYRKDALQRHLKTHRAACPTDATVDLVPLPPPPPPSSPESHGPVCNLCAKTFASQKTLKRHRQTVHHQSDGFSCRVCDRCFYRRDNLRKHHISKHADEE